MIQLHRAPRLLRLSHRLVSLFIVAGVLRTLPGAGTVPDLPDPDSSAQNEMLNRIAQYSQQYVDNLPDFICIQVVQQFESRPHSEKWRKGDSLAFRLVFSQRQEQHRLEMVNGKQLKPGMRPPRVALTTEGEFGVLMANVFSAHSDARFAWAGWTEKEDKHLANFKYWIDKEHSTLKLSLSDLAQAVLAYSGTITADPSTGEVWRLTNGTSDIPDEIRTKSISTEINYDEVAIGGRDYLLPVHATVLTETPNRTLRNELTFGQYRKFATDSTITFATEDNKPAKSSEKDKTPQF